MMRISIYSILALIIIGPMQLIGQEEWNLRKETDGYTEARLV